MTIVGGWSTLATRHNGLTDKKYSTPNAGLGICCHSIEGSIAGALSRFDSTAKNASGSYTPAAAASCMWLNPKVGRLIQCYPVTASTWTSGNRKANTELWAVESEGVAGERLNANQVANMLTLRDEFETHTGLGLGRGSSDGVFSRNLFQHSEVWNWESPNTGPTACPSGRYAPFFEALEDEMELWERVERLEALVAGNGYRLPRGAVVIGEEALEAAAADGGSLFLGLGNTQAALASHTNAHPGGAPLAPGTQFTVEVL